VFTDIWLSLDQGVMLAVGQLRTVLAFGQSIDFEQVEASPRFDGRILAQICRTTAGKGG